MTPQRVQRKRMRGWRMPSGVVYVGRPTRWGNPFTVSATLTPAEAVECYRAYVSGGRWPLPPRPLGAPTREEIRDELAGHDLACWCPLEQPCHADVLLAIANGEATP